MGELKFNLLPLLISKVWASSESSVLVPAGEAAIKIAELFWWMLGGAIIIWLWVVALSIYATLVKPKPHNARKTAYFVIGGGVVIPVIVISTLVVFSVPMVPELVARAPQGSMQIEISGVQWWWRVKYLDPKAQALELANEVRVPVGESIQLILSTEDVIHSLWIPALSGKMDMIPGRKTYLTIKATKVGVYQGICAEYCGMSHAKMQFKVVVMPKRKFEEWLALQRQPYQPLATSNSEKGEKIFLKYGCTACHSVRGLSQVGRVGPDLTHFGSRNSLGAGIMPNEIKYIHKWIKNTDRVKPGVKMPVFHMLTDEEVGHLSEWLKGLR